jgi:ABC-type transport system, involved in lipoprotein release, permease component
VHGHGRNVRQGDEPLLGHRVPDMDRGPGDTAGRHRRREQHHAGAGQGAHAGDRHPPRPGRTAYGHHLADTLRKFHPHLHRRGGRPHGRGRGAVGRRLDLLSGGDRGPGGGRNLVADLVRDRHAGAFHPRRGQPAGGRHPRLPGPEHQGCRCNTWRI